MTSFFPPPNFPQSGYTPLSDHWAYKSITIPNDFSPEPLNPPYYYDGRWYIPGSYVDQSASQNAPHLKYYDVAVDTWGNTGYAPTEGPAGAFIISAVEGDLCFSTAHEADLMQLEPGGTARTIDGTADGYFGGAASATGGLIYGPDATNTYPAQYEASDVLYGRSLMLLLNGTAYLATRHHLRKQIAGHYQIIAEFDYFLIYALYALQGYLLLIATQSATNAIVFAIYDTDGTLVKETIIPDTSTLWAQSFALIDDWAILLFGTSDRNISVINPYGDVLTSFPSPEGESPGGSGIYVPYRNSGGFVVQTESSLGAAGGGSLQFFITDLNLRRPLPRMQPHLVRNATVNGHRFIQLGRYRR